MSSTDAAAALAVGTGGSQGSAARGMSGLGFQGEAKGSKVMRLIGRVGASQR